MKNLRISIFLLAIIALLVFSVMGCSKSQETTEPEETQEQAEETQQQEEEPEAGTGPEINMLDVVSLKDINADLIVKDVREITEGDYLDVGQKFISVWVFLKNTGSDTIYVDYSPFILVDTDGTEYEASYSTPGVMYSAGYVLPGGTFEGPVYFIVPDDAKAYSLKSPQDLAWGTTNLAEIDLQESSDDPGASVFAADTSDYYSGAQHVDPNTEITYGDKMAITVTDGHIVNDPPEESTEGYVYYQVSVSIKNLTGEDLSVSMDYSYMLYSQTYNCLTRQISLPFADNEMWVETLAANETRDFVITFEVKEDSAQNYMFLQDFFEENEPVLFSLP